MVCLKFGRGAGKRKWKVGKWKGEESLEGLKLACEVVEVLV